MQTVLLALAYIAVMFVVVRPVVVNYFGTGASRLPERRTAAWVLVALLVSAALIVLVAAFSAVLVRSGVLAEQPGALPLPDLPQRPALRDWLHNRYLLTITAVLLLAQVVEPIVEYQFMHFVQREFPEREARTAYLSGFLSLLNAVALGINLIVTPLVLRGLGAIGGMLAQPLPDQRAVLPTLEGLVVQFTVSNAAPRAVSIPSGLRVGASVVDDAVSMIRRRIERVELQ